LKPKRWIDGARDIQICGLEDDPFLFGSKPIFRGDSC